MGSYSCILCHTDSVAMLQYCMLTASDCTGVYFVSNESWISLSVSGTATSVCLITHGLAQLCHVISSVKAGSWEQGQGGREGEGVRWLHCCTGFCHQQACSCRKRPWVVAWRWEQGALAEGAAVRRRLLWSHMGWLSCAIFLLLLLSLWVFLLLLLLLQLTSLLLFLSWGLLLSSLPQVWPEKVAAGFGEVRAAAAPWWRPGPCALWPPSLTAKAAPAGGQRGTIQERIQHQHKKPVANETKTNQSKKEKKMSSHLRLW